VLDLNGAPEEIRTPDPQIRSQLVQGRSLVLDPSALHQFRTRSNVLKNTMNAEYETAAKSKAIDSLPLIMVRLHIQVLSGICAI
jgi:hypothetical protein